MVKNAETTEGKLETGKQKTLKVLSKILEVVAIIGKVCLWIALVCLIICAIIFPIVTKDLNVTKEEITYKSEIIELRENEDKLDIYYKDKKIGDMSTADKEIVFKAIDEINAKKLWAVAEVVMVFGVVLIILMIIMFGYAIKIFKNINRQSTPFIEDNVKYIRKIAYFMIAALVVSAIGEIIVSAISAGGLDYNFDVVSIGGILGMFILSYIFEYGCKLQEESKATIYDE